MNCRDSVLLAPWYTLRTGGTQSFYPPGTLWTGGDSVISAPGYPVDWRGSVLSAPRYPAATGGTQPLRPPGALWIGGAEVLSAPQLP